MLSASVENKINYILNAFETGAKDGDYGQVCIYDDDETKLRADKKQITFGSKQTTESGALKVLIQMYVNTKGAKYAAYFKQKLSLIGRKSLVDDKTFISMLKKSGSDPAMVIAQDLFFDIQYGQRARDFFKKNEFTLPLSYAVIFDSIIHSGQIRDDIRMMFTQVPPSKGGDEKAWIKAYVNARRKWLTERQNPKLRKTVYRMGAFLDAVANDNWLLDKPFNANGAII